MSSPNNLKKIRGDYFLQKIFDMMNLQKKLKIIKINKNIQKRTNINYCQRNGYNILVEDINKNDKLNDINMNFNDD